jgi:hypothetical protein
VGKVRNAGQLLSTHNSNQSHDELCGALSSIKNLDWRRDGWADRREFNLPATREESWLVEFE